MTEQQNPAQGGAQASTSIVPAGPAPEELAARAFLRMSVFNARALMSQDFPPVKELVPGIMPCGLSLLVSAPKIGKSWLALGLAYELATGGKALGGIPVSPRPVLYLALEDGCRRLQSRLRHMGIKEIPRDLWFRVRFERDLGPLESMNAFFSKFKDQGPLVILDTLGKVLPYFTPQGRESVFEHDYRVMSAFKNLVDGYDGATLLIIHHVRKDKTSDFLENVSGTNAIAGAADTIMLLSRKRGESEGTLEVTSRDTEEGSYALHFDNDHGLWSLQGDSLEEAKQTARQSLLTVNKGELMTGIIKYVTAQHKPVSAKEVVDAFPGFKEKTVREYLNRAQEAEAIRKLGRGQYASLDYTGVETVETVENGEKPIWDWSTPANSTDSTNSTQSGNRRQTTKSYWGPFPTEKVSGGGTASNCDVPQGAGLWCRFWGEETMAQHSTGVVRRDPREVPVAAKVATAGLASLVVMGMAAPGAVAVEVNPSPQVEAVTRAGVTLAEAQKKLAEAEKDVASKQAALDAARKLTAADLAKTDKDVAAAQKALAEAQAGQKTAADAVAKAQAAYEQRLKDLGISDVNAVRKAQEAVTAAQSGKDAADKTKAEADKAKTDAEATAGRTAADKTAKKDALDKADADAAAKKTAADKAAADADKAGATTEAIQTAQGKVDAAAKDVTDAQKVADTAKQQQADAKKTADDTKVKADAAKKEAADAKTKADEAQAKADEAKKKLDQAKGDQSVAELKAAYEKAKAEYEAAQKTAADKKQAADTAKTEADQAKADADQAKKDADTLKADADGKKQAADTAQKQLDKGAIGFLEQEGSDAAKDLVTNDKTFKEWMDKGWISTKDFGTSFSLDNMKKSLSYIDYFNQLRKEAGLSELKVTDYLMGTAMADNEAIQNNDFNHPNTYPVSENIAMGYDDPQSVFKVWYTDEKNYLDEYAKSDPELEAHKTDTDWIYNNRPWIYHGEEHDGVKYEATGHYLNIIDKTNTLTGFGVGHSYGANGGLWGEFQTQHFQGKYGNDKIGYTTSEYLDRINKYESGLNGIIDAWKTADKAATDKQTEADNLSKTATDQQKAADEAAAQQKAAEDAVVKLKAAMDAAKKAYEDAQNGGTTTTPATPEELAKLQKAYEEAKAAADQAQKDYESKQAQADAFAGQQEKADKALADANDALAAADKTLAGKQAVLKTETGKLDALKAARKQADEARAAYERAVSVQADAKTAYDKAVLADNQAQDAVARTAKAAEQADKAAADAAAALKTAQDRLAALLKGYDDADLKRLYRELQDAQKRADSAKRDVADAQAKLDTIVADRKAAAIAQAEKDLQAAVQVRDKWKALVDSLTPTPNPTPTPTPTPTPKPEVTTEDVYRLYNRATGEHLLTAGVAERDALTASGAWRYEGVAFKAVQKNGTEVRRYYRPGGKHMLTTNPVEQNALIRAGWRYEGVAFLAPEDSTTTNDVYRLYNPYNGDHLFTTSSAEKNAITAHGWSLEGVPFDALK